LKILGDGIFDRLNNDQIFDKIWGAKKLGESINDIHSFCGKITDAIIKYSMEKDSVDNVSVVYIAFKNFEKKMKDPNFVYQPKTKCQEIKKDKIDFSLFN
jgi:serine/threonine protein phosphatase PrpC